MPPRSVCLNVFTTSLGSGSVNKETEVVARETTGGNGAGAAEERARHDSVQEGMYCFAVFTPSIFPYLIEAGRDSIRGMSHILLQILSLQAKHSRRLSPLQTPLPLLPLPSMSPPSPLISEA